MRFADDPLIACIATVGTTFTIFLFECGCDYKGECYIAGAVVLLVCDHAWLDSGDHLFSLPEMLRRRGLCTSMFLDAGDHLFRLRYPSDQGFLQVTT